MDHRLNPALRAALEAYIRQVYRPQPAVTRPAAKMRLPGSGLRRLQADDAMTFGAAEAEPCPADEAGSLTEALQTLDEGFSQTLLRHIDAKGMTDAACYKKAGIDRKLFSKIRSDPDYRPSKPTAVAFALALELTPAEAADLLRRAGFALSHSNKFDVIIEYCLQNGVYDRFTVNQALYEFDQPLLGV